MNYVKNEFTNSTENFNVIELLRSHVKRECHEISWHSLEQTFFI
ncbi:hypothetical protein ASZ90_006683 [hydrocarbon metagenome]|uniref:Uncharacterized protein n=1 Tax=hydrocarbon metagenome TaxID=938273 RepID=A0A0W8FRY0_9ZZZZ